MCGALRASDAGEKAVLMGWVNKRRDLGSLIFVDLRDRTGVTQVVINAERDAAIHEKAEALRNEYVIGYQPPHSAATGKYHHVRVKSNVPKVNVYARNGYYAP